MTITKQTITFYYSRPLSFIILMFFIGHFIYAQNLLFDHYGLSEGLPQETIHCITKDKNGFLWLGTSDGVVRFDGHDFITPLPDNLSGIDIAGYRIGAIQSHQNQVYIGTGQNGLLVFDIITEAIKSLYLSDANCTRILTLGDMVIAAYYNQGLVVIQNGEVFPLRFDIENPKEIIGLSAVGQTVYLATKNGRLFSFQLDPHALKKSITLRSEYHIPFQINNLVAIDSTVVLCSNNGLYQFNAASPLTHVDINSNTNSKEFQINDILKIEDSFFIATTSGLLKCTWNGSGFDSHTHYKAGKKYDEYTINSDNTYTLFYDEGLLYIGNINLDITSVQSNPVFEQPTDQFNLDNPSVFAVIDTQNNLFIGSSSGLIITNHQYPEVYTILPQYRVRSFTKDRENNIWLATNTGAYVIPLDNLDIHNPKIIKLPVSSESSSALRDENLRSVYTDNHNNIWVVTYNSGFSKFIGSVKNNDLRFKNYSAEAFPSLFTLSMVQDKNDDFWMCTQKGLSRFKIKNGNFQLIKNYEESDGLATKGVLSAFIDSSEQLWIASRKGLNKYHPNLDRFTSYGKRDGLKNTFVYNITEDNAHHLWLSTNGGLFRFDISEEQFANYNPKDGVQSTEFNLGAVYKHNDGNLYFGGINGLNVFNPNRIHELDREGHLSFTSLEIKNNPITAQTSEQLASSITSATKLDLDYNDFPINLSFSALDFRPNSNSQYLYKLLPEDTEWHRLNDNNSLQLLTLAPKSYTLQIQGQSRNQLWLKPPLELAINVKPPWYRSNSAYLLYLLIFLSIVYAFYQVSLQRQIAGQESKRLQDLDDLKSRFITNITHEFRTPLTVIQGYLSHLKDRFSEKADVNTALNTIEQNSNNLLHLVNQMLDLAKLEQGKLTLNTTQSDLVSYVQYLVHSFSSIAEETSIDLKFSSEIEELVMDFDAERMRQILTNLISNALKFSSEQSKISVSLRTFDACAEIKVIDQGLGIPEDELPHIFDRFFQVENQNHKVSQGTGIGLSLTKELVQLMDGRIEVESRVNQGTTFTLKFPIKNETLERPLELKALQSSIGKTYVPQLEDVIVNEDTNAVLIVEDNPDMARYIASCLQPHYKVTFAKHGLEGFEKAQEQIPDIVITDVMMPVMDGFELTQKLQSHINTNHIPIIMLTSKAMQEDKLEGISSGADAYLTKPFQKQELLLRMQMLIRKRQQLQTSYGIDKLKTSIDKVPDKNLEFLNKVIAIIHEHLEDSNFNATELSKALAMSDSQLYRKLKAISNSSTSIFIRKVRLDKSKALLKTTTLSVSEVAYATGFNDPNWFSKAFKEAYGMSPTEFRN